MKRGLFILALIVLGLFIGANAQDKPSINSNLMLWYNKPAVAWTEALPLGNGYMGAMVFGGVNTERLQLNESTLYSGEPSATFKDIDVRKNFPKVTALLAEGKYEEAQKLVVNNWLGRNHQSYQPLGDFTIDFTHHGTAENYQRNLDLASATANVSYVVNGTKFSRAYFASYPDRLIAIKLKAEGSEKINCVIKLNTPHTPMLSYEKGKKQLSMAAQAPGFVVRRTLAQIENDLKDQYKYPELYQITGERKAQAKQVLYGKDIDNLGMYFNCSVKIIKNDGVVEETDSSIKISNASEVYLVLTAATSFNGYDKSPSREGKNPAAIVGGIISKASKSNYQSLYNTHLKDYQQLFNRVNIQLATVTKQSKLTTDTRVALFNNGNDPSLVNLFFQYGRYLMIAGSRKGGQPLNLQGIWNDKIIPPWNSAYTLNINAQMNYWPAELTNLSECQEPFIEAIKELAVNGKATAQNMYGLQGWTVHHNTDIWRHTEPVDYCDCAFWPMAGGWLVSHFWERYLFNGDERYLKNEVYPLLRGAVEFYNGWLVKNKEGYWVTPIGHSPEQSFIYDGDKNASMSPGPTMDMAIVRESFSRYIEACEKLKINDALLAEVKIKIAKLLHYQIGKYGQLQEWQDDFEDGDVKHRHVSHLYGFYPGNQINPWDNPELTSAVNTVLERRGDKATGWAMGWRINLQARLLNANKAYDQLSNLLVLVNDSDTKMSGGGTYPNLMDAHPPFQIDGNFGATAGIAEMLLQSYAGEIVLLPALPKAWYTGKITGLKARGGFLIDMEWEKGKIKKAVITSTLGGNLRLRLAQKITINAPFRKAENKNVNPLFSHIEAKSFKGIAHVKSDFKIPEFNFVYDLDTRVGQVLTIR